MFMERPQKSVCAHVKKVYSGSDVIKFEVPRNLVWKSTDFLRRIIVSDIESDSLTMSYVCSTGGLFPIEDFLWWKSEEHAERNRRKAQCNWRCAASGRVLLA